MPWYVERTTTDDGTLRVTWKDDVRGECTEETFCGACGVTLHVSGSLSEPFPPHVEWSVARTFADAFLRVADARHLSRSRTVRACLTAARPWRVVLRSLWCAPLDSEWDQETVRLLQDEAVADEYFWFVDGTAVTRQLGRDDGLNERGLQLLRKVQAWPHTVACYRTSCEDEFSVTSVAALPLTTRRFVVLHGMRLFDAVDVTSSYGLLVDGEGRHRTLAVPHDADLAHLHHAIASLVVAPGVCRDAPDEAIVLPWDTVLREPFVSSDATLHPYRMRCGPAGVALLRDADVASDATAHAISLDALAPCAVASDACRVARWRLRQWFPHLCDRLAAEADAVDACYREVRGRRVAPEWTLEGVDGGANLSPFGMAVLFAFVLADWVGARVRVFASASRRVACVGVWSVDAFVLVDPCRTTVNALDLGRAPPRAPLVAMPTGALVRVKARTRWHVAQIVERNAFGVLVRDAETGRARWISEAHAWERLGNDDTDRVLRRITRRLERMRRSGVR